MDSFGNDDDQRALLIEEKDYHDEGDNDNKGNEEKNWLGSLCSYFSRGDSVRSYNGWAKRQVFTLFPMKSFRFNETKEEEGLVYGEGQEGLQAPFILTGAPSLSSRPDIDSPTKSAPDGLLSLEVLDSNDNRPTFIAVTLALVYAVRTMHDLNIYYICTDRQIHAVDVLTDL